MICGRANAQEHTVTELTSKLTAEGPTIVYPEAMPMEIALERIAAVLIVLLVIACTLLGCLVYLLTGSLAFVCAPVRSLNPLSVPGDDRRQVGQRNF
jgi:hypothetical protein